MHGGRRTAEQYRAELERVRRQRDQDLEDGICTRCRKTPVDPSREFSWCAPCRKAQQKVNKASRDRVMADCNNMRPEMISLYGDPNALWRDNECRDGARMRRLPNVIRAQHVLDSWLREA